MAEYGPGGGGANKNMGAPECTQRYYPNAGGYEGGAIESGGELGEKEPMPSPNTSITGNTEEGDYNTVVNSWPPNIPHGTPDPELGGPPLATTPDDPSRSQY